jgi:hypothetical protein
LTARTADTLAYQVIPNLELLAALALKLDGHRSISGIEIFARKTNAILTSCCGTSKQFRFVVSDQ